MRITLLLLTVAIALTLPLGVATADPSPARDTAALANLAAPAASATARGRKLRVPLMIAENALMIGAPAYSYWSTIELQKEDWELGWSWSTWKSKLFSTDALVFDTNRFEPNAMRHSLAGALTYQIGRANGLGPLGSTIMNFGASFFWENVGEFRERPAINDLFVNTISGILIGEPLFQIGKLADGQGGLVRRGLGLLVSPFSRAQKEVGLSSLVDEVAPAHRIELSAGTNVVHLTGERDKVEARVGLDVEVMTDRAFGLPGTAATWTGLGGWNRMAFDAKLAERSDGHWNGFHFLSSTTYAGRYSRNIDDAGRGTGSFIGLGGSFEVHQRAFATELDRYAVFSVLSPRAAGWVRSDRGELDWEVGASADAAMVQAHALDKMPLMEDASILATRGYYYATGVTASARVRARTGRWNGELSAIAHQFWSFDEHSYGGDFDPKDVQDERAVAKANIGVRPTAKDFRVELYTDAVLRRGAWESLDRRTTKLAAGMSMTAGF